MRPFTRNPTFWGRAGAGILFFCEDSVLLVKRSAEVREPLTWGVPGGSVSGEGSFDSEEFATENLPEKVFWRGAIREAYEELGGLPAEIAPFDKVVFQSEGFTYITFFVRISKSDRQNWIMKLNWENDEAVWFPLSQLPAPLHPGMQFIVSQKKELFPSTDLQVKWISDHSWRSVFVLPKGTVLWHGTPEPYLNKIEKAGFLRNDMWTRQNQEHKTSRGTLYEEGLIWLFTSVTAATEPDKVLEEAKTYARGRELHQPIASGGVIEVETPFDMKICYRYKKLTRSEIYKLEDLLSPAESYVELEPGLELEYAVYRLFKAKHLTYKDILPVLGYRGISFQDNQIGLLVDRLPIKSFTKIS